MEKSLTPSTKQKLKFLPLHCITKTDNDFSSLQTRPATRLLDVPQPIDEFVDYTTDAHVERSLKWTQRAPEVILVTEGSEESSTCSCESRQSAVEDVIEVAIVGQAETGLSSVVTTKLQQQPSMGIGASVSGAHSVRLAEGLSIGSDKSPRISARSRGAGGGSHDALNQLGDPMAADDAEGPVIKESLVDAKTAASLNASQSVTDTARSHSGGDPSDVLALKRTVRRLTAELSRLLMAPRADGKSADEVDSAKLLPGKGPLPPWLCEPRVFAPLMAAYDLQLAAGSSGGDGGGASGSSSSAVAAVDARLLDMEARVLDVVRENERLRLKLREAATAGQADQTDWDAFTEQARLVLEENQLLLRQLSVQQDRAQAVQRGHLAEVAKLKYRIDELETENAQVRGEFDSLHDKLQEVKSKYQTAALERETGELKTVDCMRSLSKELHEAREGFARSNEELLRQLQKSESEKVKLTKALADATTERDGLRFEMSELRTRAQLRSKENQLLHRSAKREAALQDYLESVVDAATILQTDLDAVNQKLEEQETQLGALVGHLVGELQFHEKNITGEALNEEILNKMPKLTSKFEFVIKRFASLLKANEDKREQLDKQVCYLQSLIKEKSQLLHHLEAEQRTVAADLESVWNAAVSS